MGYTSTVENQQSAWNLPYPMWMEKGQTQQTPRTQASPISLSQAFSLSDLSPRHRGSLLSRDESLDGDSDLVPQDEADRGPHLLSPASSTNIDPHETMPSAR